MGCSLRRLHSKRLLVSFRKSVAHKFPGIRSCTAGPKKVPRHSARKNCSSCHRQHYSCGLHKQGGRYEVRLTLCPSMASPVLVQSETHCSKGHTHPRSSECNCGQVIQMEWSLHQEVFNLLCQTWHLPQVDMFATRYNCKLTKFVSPVPDPNAWAVDALTVSWEDLESDQQTVRSSVQLSDTDSSGLAQHAVVLGSGRSVVRDTHLSPKPPRSCDSTVQRGSSQGSSQSQSSRLAPRAEAIKEQGFSSPVAVRIKAPQRHSTRSVYEAKWAVFVRWCETSQVDFRSPSVKQVADFVLHLFQEKNLQPSTINGYRSAIVDKLGNASLNVSKDENLTRLLDNFHRDRPKGCRGVPSWNLSLVLHQLTKPPFEPLRKVSLKHLTFKAVFLLALGSGKRSSEIHTWLNKNVRHQADWSKVSLYPSPSFLAKNHLANEGPECVVQWSFQLWPLLWINP